MMTCKKFRERAYLKADELDAAESAALAQHRQHCAACASDYALIERSRRAIEALHVRTPRLRDPMALINATAARIESDVREAARPAASRSVFERWIVFLLEPRLRMAMACALLLIAGAFALESTSGFIEMKGFERELDRRPSPQTPVAVAGLDENALIRKAVEVSKLLGGKGSSLALTEKWVMMNRQSLEEFLVLYSQLKANASKLPPEFRAAHPRIMKLLEADRPGAGAVDALVKDREALIQELNRLLPEERPTP